jgi:Response regulator of the LytR/AlgR family
MKRKRNIPKTRIERWVDLLVWLVIIPCLIAVFPVEEWILWRVSDVIVYLMWTYLCVVSRPEGDPDPLGVGQALDGPGGPVPRDGADVPDEHQARALPPRHRRRPASAAVSVPAGGLGALHRRHRRRPGRRTARPEDPPPGGKAQAKEEEHTDRAVAEARAAQAVAGETVTVKADYKDVTVPLASIQYIEARNNYACLHLDRREDIVSQITMKALLEMLPEGKFVRIHRSFIIPVHRIEKKTASSVKLVGVDTPLPVGRAHKENLK